MSGRSWCESKYVCCLVSVVWSITKRFHRFNPSSNLGPGVYKMNIKIEIPKDSLVKTQGNSVNRILAIPMPVNYGEIIGTKAADGDAFDAVILNETFHNGQQIALKDTKLVAIVDYIDDGELDTKGLFLFNPGSKEAYTNDTYKAPYSVLYYIERYVAYLRWYKAHDMVPVKVERLILDVSLAPYVKDLKFSTELTFESLTANTLGRYFCE